MSLGTPDRGARRGRFFIFAHDGEPWGGLHDYIASFSRSDTAQAHVERIGSAWAQVACVRHGCLVAIGEWRSGCWEWWDPDGRMVYSATQLES